MKRSLIDFLLGRKKPKLNVTHTLIDKGTTISGGINFTGTLRVHGVIKSDAPGGIFSSSQDSTLFVGKNGSVNSIHLHVDHLVIEGGGSLECDANINVMTLTVKKGGSIKAKRINYVSMDCQGSVLGEIFHIPSQMTSEQPAEQQPSA